MINTGAQTSIAAFYRRLLLWWCPVLIPGGLLYDAYLNPSAAIPSSRYALIIIGLGLVAAAHSGWLNARDIIRSTPVLCFAFMAHMALALADSHLNPMVLSSSTLVALGIGCVLHNERLLKTFYLFAGVLLCLAISLTEAPAIYKALMSLNAVAFSFIMAAFTTRAIRTQSQAHGAEQVSNAVFEYASDVMVYSETFSGKVLRCNEQARRLFETNDKEKIAELVMGAYLATRPNDSRTEAVRAALQEPVQEITLQLFSAQDNSFWGQMTARRVKVNDIDLTLLRISDVTASLQERRDLQQTKLLLDRSQQLAQLGGWEFSATTGRWSFTEVALEILELENEPSTANLVKLFRDPEQKREVFAIFRRALKGDAGIDLVADIQTHSGKNISLHMIAEQVREEGSVTGLFGIFADVSVHREREQALQEARDAAESSAQSRSQFLANMSHEIRTPMNGVIGMASLLADTSLDPQQNAYVETIRSSGESLLHILNEILDFSKIDADQITLENRVFEVEKCVFDAIALVAPLTASKELEILCEMDNASRGFFYGDTLRLRQVLVNLLSNAIKFTESGEIVVRVQHNSEGHARLNSRLTLSIQDTGIGIPEDQIPTLFEPFTQADSSTTRRYGGTGLGLSICKRLVELMGGDIEISSAVGSGTTFAFTIDAQETDLPRELPDFDGSNLRVIAVDDNKTNRVILETMLESMSIDAVVHDHPDSARADFANNGADLIITDMQMPDMDGLELLQELQASHASATKPFPKCVLLSSLDATLKAANLFDAVLIKPVRPSELQASLVELLRYRSPGDAVQSIPASSTLQKNQGSSALQELPTASISLLLAEDNLVNQAVAKGMLEKLGINADLANNGREALEMLQLQSYDIILMDVQMPELDGLEATRLVRADTEIAQPYIIAMTANAMHEDRIACAEVGMDDFLAKPIRVEDVHACLSIALEARNKNASAQNAEANRAAES